MRCADNCGYYYKAEGDEFERCQFEGPDGWAPCDDCEMTTACPYYYTGDDSEFEKEEE